MWNTLSYILLAAEIALLIFFAIGRSKKKNLQKTVVFIGLVFIVDLFIVLLPYIHGVTVMGKESNYLLDILDRILGTVKLFVGDVDTDVAAEFSKTVPVFTAVYLLGVVLALATTISTALEAFNLTMMNSIRTSKLMKAPYCDIVVGNSDKALAYAKNESCVLLLDDTIPKETAVELMDEGYAVIRRSFSVELLKSRRFRENTRYNIICVGDTGKHLGYIDTFISYNKAVHGKDIRLFVEIDADKADTVRREIIGKSGFESCITTFCSEELLARTVTEENPITKYMPRDLFLDDTSVRGDASVNVIHLGFRDLSRELYRQSVLNNQLVTYDREEYRVFPVNYHIYDKDVEQSVWNIGGLALALESLNDEAEAYFPIPEMPFRTIVTDKMPHLRDTLSEVVKTVLSTDSFTYIIVDTGDDYRNIDTGARLRSMLSGNGNFHIFVRSDAEYTEDDGLTTYFGRFETILTHDVIVNESLSEMAKKLNEVYTAYYMSDKKNSPDFSQLVRTEAEKTWNGLDFFTLYSNIHLAMNLRLKLNLLGLDYVNDGKGENTALIGEKYQRRDGEYEYKEHFGRSKRNAMIAQEHSRWNAYHLLGEYLPLEKSDITVKSNDGNKVRFNTKDIPAKRHACLTTYKGLDALSSYLADTASSLTGEQHVVDEYNYYIYDEMLITSAEELLRKLGYSVCEK